MNAFVRAAAVAALALAPLSSATRATASDASSAAAAEALYQEGKQLLLAGSTETACGRLAASQSIQPGIGTLLLLGHCYEALGKTASAWASFRAAESFARSAHQNERAEIASVRAAALESRLSRLRILLPADIDTKAWSVLDDERPLPVASLDTPLPVDPGEHALRISAPGFEPWATRVVIPAEPALTELRVPKLAASAPTSSPPGTRATALAPAAVPAVGSAPEGLRHWGMLGTGLGAAGLAVGLGYALHAQHQYDQSLDRCRTETLCSAPGLALRDRAHTSARVATLASLSGAVFALGGLVLWWSAGKVEPALEGPPPLELGVGALGLEPAELGSSVLAADRAGLGVRARGAF